MKGSKLSLAFAVLAGILWGGAGVFVRIFASFGMNSITILEIKAGFAVLIMLVMILIKDPALLKLRKSDLGYVIIIGFFGVFVLNLMYNTATMALSLSLTTVIFSLSVFMVPIISSRMFGEHMSLKQYVYMVCAVAGCAMVSGLFEGGLSYSLVGIAAAFGAATCNALFNILSKRLLNRGCHNYTINIYTLAVGAIAAIPLADWSVIADVIAQNPSGNLSLMVLHSLLASVLPGILYMLSVKNLKTATATSLEVGSEPPAAMIFGLLFFSEIPSVLMVIGLIIVVVSLCLMSRGESGEDQEAA